MMVRSRLDKGRRTVAYVLGSYRRSSGYLFADGSGIRRLFVGSGLFFAATIGVGMLFFAAPLPLVPAPPLIGTLPVAYFVTFELLLAPLYGYLFRVIRHTMELDPEPPWFEDPSELVRLGFKGSAITLILLDIPWYYPELAIDIIGRLLAIPFGLGGVYPVILFSAIFAYPAALVSVAETGRLRDALAVRRFRRLLLNWNYVIIAVPVIGVIVVRTGLVASSLAIWQIAVQPGHVESVFDVETSFGELISYGVVTILFVSPLAFYLLVTTCRVVGSHWLAITGSDRPFEPLDQHTLDDVSWSKYE